jgi:hypothetical protein
MFRFDGSRARESGPVCVCVAAVVVLLVRSVVGADVGGVPAESVPGSKRVITVKNDSGSVIVNAVVVPSGRVFEDPGADAQAKESEVAAFLCADREATVRLYETWASDAAKASLHSRIEKFAFESSLQESHAFRRNHPDEYVSFWITPEEAASVTLAMNEALRREGNGGPRSIVQQRFRLPTANEWRQAMSAGSSQDSRNINPWPSYPTDFTEREKGMCEENWQQSGGVGDFTGSPTQIAWLIEESAGSAAKRREIVDLFTRSLLVGREHAGQPSWLSNAEPAGELEKIDVAPPNKWGIYGAHRCYPEWVLAIDSQADANALWRRLEEGTATENDFDRQVFQLCGAGAITAGKDANGQDDISQLMDLFLWRTQRLRGEAITCSWKEAADGDISIDRNVTFRLVLVETLADEWMSVVRGQLLASHELKDLEAAAKKCHAAVAVLSANESRDNALIDAYAAIALYQCGQRSLAGQNLTAAAQRITPSKKQKPNFGNIFGNRPKPSSDKPPSATPQPSEDIFLAATSKLMAKDEAVEADVSDQRL